MIISSKASKMAVSQMENVKVHDGKNHPLENSEVVYLLNTNALKVYLLNNQAGIIRSIFQNIRRYEEEV